MTISVNYQKRKNNPLFTKFQNNKHINLSNIQNYIPIYDRFFSLNHNNWNSINLNHQWSITDIKDSKKKEDQEHIFNCTLKNTTDDDDLTTSQPVFIKMAPLLDPFKYVVGKYNHTDPLLFNLPSFENTTNVHPKISDPNNSSFVDGFFSFLTSKILHEHKFIHGVDYYGSFLAIKNNYKINIMDDIDYLIQSEFFNNQKDVLFTVEDYSHLISQIDKTPLKPLHISSSVKSTLSAKSIDDSIFENIFVNNKPISLDDVKKNGYELLDITESSYFDIEKQDKTETLNSGSTCSSRTSHTVNDNEDNSDNEDDDNEDDDNDNEHDDNEGSISTIEEETIFLTLPQFPVQVICTEQCENTFDDLIMNEELTDDEWFSALMQIIMILITYQKLFSFTHNDLHTNNVMYISTKQKFIYYTYKKKTYKVPTFGKIYKIIDFGRSIYKLNGKVFCSDSFKVGGDASTQYNTEPYLNEDKPRLEANFSFDLCRLACSIFDYLIDDIDEVKNLNECSPLIRLIVEWCMDDNGINVLYKNNGTERYPDFKLYKMIARCVHNHTPTNQLERNEFNKFLIPNKNISKTEQIIDIDILPTYN